MSENINVTIVTTKVNTIATAMRAHINSTLSYRKLGEVEKMNKEIDSLRKDFESFIAAVRSE